MLNQFIMGCRPKVQSLTSWHKKQLWSISLSSEHLQNFMFLSHFMPGAVWDVIKAFWFKWLRSGFEIWASVRFNTRPLLQAKIKVEKYVEFHLHLSFWIHFDSMRTPDPRLKGKAPLCHKICNKEKRECKNALKLLEKTQIRQLFDAGVNIVNKALKLHHYTLHYYYYHYTTQAHAIQTT